MLEIKREKKKKLEVEDSNTGGRKSIAANKGSQKKGNLDLKERELAE